jgi:hypothetical protein
VRIPSQYASTHGTNSEVKMLENMSAMKLYLNACLETCFGGEVSGRQVPPASMSAILCSREPVIGSMNKEEAG